jgi:ribosome maturation factor RimP
MSTSTTTATIERVEALVEPIADDFAVEIVDIDFKGGVLRIVVDRPEGIDSGAIVDVTKAVSRMLDAEDPISGRFTLEVSSPGVERTLRTPKHFERAIGADVTVKTNPDVEGDRRVDGRLDDADEYGITITGEHGARTLRYGEIRSARTTFDWGPTPKPGHTKKTSSPGETHNKEAAGR